MIQTANVLREIEFKLYGVLFLGVVKRSRYENDVPEKWYICQV